MQISEHLNHSVFWSECSIKLTDIVVSTPPLERSRCSLHLLPWIRNSWFGSPRCNHGSKESEIHRQSTSNLKFWILVWQVLHRHCTRIRALVGIYRISIPRQCNELKPQWLTLSPAQILTLTLALYTEYFMFMLDFIHINPGIDFM